MKIQALILAATLAIPSLSLAQEPGGPPPGGMGSGPRGEPMLQNTIEWILTQKEHYRPNGEQVARLAAAAKLLNDSIAGSREEIRKLREETSSEDGDRRARFQKMRPLMEQIRKQDEAATRAALQILNGEQQKVVEELLAERRKEMEARRRMRAPQG